MTATAKTKRKKQRMPSGYLSDRTAALQRAAAIQTRWHGPEGATDVRRDFVGARILDFVRWSLRDAPALTDDQIAEIVDALRTEGQR